MAAVVSHYEPIWLCSWSHQRAVSTQTTAALPLSAAVKTARDLLQFRMAPAPPRPPWCGCRLDCRHARRGFVTGSGSDRAPGLNFAGLLTGVMSPPSVLYGCREELPSGRSAASAREDKIKTRLSFCWDFLSHPASLLPSASLSPSVPPEHHYTALPSQKSSLMSPACRRGVLFHSTLVTVIITFYLSDWNCMTQVIQFIQVLLLLFWIFDKWTL